MLLGRLARYVVQKAASDPETRKKMVKAAGSAADEVKKIAKEEDRAYAAGKAMRRALDNWQKGGR